MKKGVLGLAFNPDFPGLIDTMFAQNKINRNAFSIYFNRFDISVYDNLNNFCKIILLKR
jgi:hypothetical protein